MFLLRNLIGIHSHTRHIHTKAEIVEQVIALASNESAKVHVARRATAAHLVHAAAAANQAGSHRCVCVCLCECWSIEHCLTSLFLLRDHNSASSSSTRTPLTRQAAQRRTFSVACPLIMRRDTQQQPQPQQQQEQRQQMSAPKQFVRRAATCMVN